MNFLLLAAGLAILIKGADYLVGGAASMAKRWGVSSLVIGLTVVAFGTSTPELVVNLISVVQGNTQLAIGNILGSNIANILLILGISAAIYPLSVKSNTVWKEIPLALLAAVAVMLMANDAAIEGATGSLISRIDGIVLIFFFIIFLYYIFGTAKQGAEEGEKVEEMSMSRSAAYVALGIAGLILGGKLLVDSAVSIATSFGLSESLIGLTVVAVGTSLPELATSAVAAFRKHADIAIGNVVGSNIFNTFWILGLSAIIRPLPVAASDNLNFAVSVGASLLLLGSLMIGKRHVLKRWQGIAFVAIYAAYIITVIVKS